MEENPTVESRGPTPSTPTLGDAMDKEETSGRRGSSGRGGSDSGEAGSDTQRANVGLRMLERLDKGLECLYTVDDSNKYFQRLLHGWRAMLERVERSPLV